jgi:hypothetical protein
MSTKNSKLLVIDASVLRASGDKDATHPTSKNCHQFLQNVLDICHRAVLTRDLEIEWNKHNSRFAQAWRGTMERRKKLISINPLEDPDLRAKIYLIDVILTDLTDNQRSDVKKDIRLIEAALATDKIVISLDDNTARKYFTRAAKEVKDLSKLEVITWVNPDKPEEKAIEWLRQGANPDVERLLGFTES